MANNESLHSAKKAKNDEFYTLYPDIESEMNAYIEYDHNVFRDKTILMPCDDPEWSNFTRYFVANFRRLGIKKLISTSYAKSAGNHQITLFELNDPKFDQDKHETHGRIFTLDRDDPSLPERLNPDNLKWDYLEGDGDFRSEEVTRLRDESDAIITNEPFSLFREFLAWIEPEKRQFAIIGNVNAITYKEVFPLIKKNNIWLGASIHSGDRKFYVPDDYPLEAAGCGVDADGRHFIRVKGVRWFTNIDHGYRHEPLQLMTMQDNLVYNKKLKKKLINSYDEAGKDLHYPKYDNYDAIEVPVTEAIPSDYDGIMGVPITFLDKYCADQYEIIGGTANGQVPKKYKIGHYRVWNNPFIGDKKVYQRILIRKKAV